MPDSSERLARAALCHYNLPPDTHVEMLSSGLNTTFKVESAARPLVLRLHRPGYRAPAHTRAELLYLRDLGNALVGDDVAVPQPVPTRSGDLVVEVSAGQHCDLLTWVDGEAPRLEDGLEPATVWRLGRALALVHNASDAITKPADLPRWDADGMFKAATSPFLPLMDIDEILSSDDRVDFESIARSTRAIFAELSADSGIIHFDYILGNTHLSRHGNDWAVGIFDFDDCGFGYYLYDLCPMLGNLAGYPAGKYNTDYPILRDALLAGYRSARRLPSAWERHLPVLMAARHANHCFLTAGLGVSPTPREDAAWRMDLARISLRLPT